MERFNPSPWFDLVAEHSENSTVAALLKVASKYPVRESLLQLRELVCKVDVVVVREALLAGVDAILDGHRIIKDNYALRFHRRPKYKNSGCVSACGEFFDLLRQAITYPKD